MYYDAKILWSKNVMNFNGIFYKLKLYDSKNNMIINLLWTNIIQGRRGAILLQSAKLR